MRIEALELSRQGRQDLIHDLPDYPKRMLARNLVLQVNVAEQAAALPILAPHSILPRFKIRKNHVARKSARSFSAAR